MIRRACRRFSDSNPFSGNPPDGGTGRWCARGERTYGTTIPAMAFRSALPLRRVPIRRRAGVGRKCGGSIARLACELGCSRGGRFQPPAAELAPSEMGPAMGSPGGAGARQHFPLRGLAAKRLRTEAPISTRSSVTTLVP